MKANTRPFVLLLSLCVGFGAASATFGQMASGTVKYAGEEFRKRAIRMGADPKCEAMYDGQRVLAQDRLVSESGGVANVFVYVKNPPAGASAAAPATAVQLTQKGCMYGPRVLGVRTDQNIDIINEDPLLHNVRALAKTNRPFNLGQPSEGTRTKSFRSAETAIKVKCDVHPWMGANVFVMDHSFFAVTDENGNFEIKGLPSGKYTVVAWHETFGELETEVAVDGDTKGIAFQFE